MIKDSDENNQGARRFAVLNKIAEALNCSVSDFAVSGEGHISQTSELLRLWMSLDNDQDRERVLSAARQIVAKS